MTIGLRAGSGLSRVGRDTKWEEGTGRAPSPPSWRLPAAPRRHGHGPGRAGPIPGVGVRRPTPGGGAGLAGVGVFPIAKRRGNASCGTCGSWRAIPSRTAKGEEEGGG